MDVMADDRDARIAHLEAELRRAGAEVDALREREALLVSQVEKRDGALSEALEQETATAEILRVIASTPSNRAEVLDALVDSAKRLCGAEVASVARVDGEEHTLVASTDPALAGHR